jgi:hypothetical protein
MALWLKWWSLVRLLRPAFSRERTFLWFAVALVAITVRGDLAGVTSYVRALALQPEVYGALLAVFHSPAIKLDKLAALWVAIVLKSFPGIVRIKGRPVFVGDGIKLGKEGRKMPAVKSLHQESASNSKPPYIMGHSCQALAALTSVAGYFFAVPLVSRIHEGLVFSNRDARTLMDKMLAMLAGLLLATPVYLVLDAYYATRKIVLGLAAQGHHLVCRARTTAVAYYPAPTPEKRKRGRPKLYGDKVLLRGLFRTASFTAAPSPVYGESDVEIMYFAIDLLWKPVGRLVRFVFVKHPTRGNIIFMTTDLLLSALDVIELYGLRFKIEVAFKQAVHTLGTYAYHFWMKDMTPIKRRGGDQHLHRKSQRYRDAVVRKMRAYHAHIQLGTIAQGMMQYLSMLACHEVWTCFGSWLRTIRPDVLPSEQVVRRAMRNSLAEFLAGSGEGAVLAKFIADRCSRIVQLPTMSASSE